MTEAKVGNTYHIPLLASFYVPLSSKMFDHELGDKPTNTTQALITMPKNLKSSIY